MKTYFTMVKTMLFSCFFLASSEVFGKDSEIVIINWYEELAKWAFNFFCPQMEYSQVHHLASFWAPCIASFSVVLLIVILSLLSGLTRLKPEKLTDEEIMPPKKFNLLAVFEVCWDVVESTLLSTFGSEERAKKFSCFLGSVFFVLLFVNMTGVIPGFEPPTTSMSFSFTVAVIVFLLFNWIGFRDSGMQYLKHMAGPVIWMAPFIFLIELISVFARPVSLSLRITGNISGDHFVFSIFSGLLDNLGLGFIPIPALFLAFGVFVSFLQAFIFMTLSAVYIKLAVESAESTH